SRRLSRAGTAIAASGLGAILFGITFLIPPEQAILAVATLVLAALVVSCSNSCGYSAAMDLGGRNLATVFGAMNICGNFAAGLCSFRRGGPRGGGWVGGAGVVPPGGRGSRRGLVVVPPPRPRPEPRPRPTRPRRAAGAVPPPRPGLSNEECPAPPGPRVHDRRY